MNRRKLRELNTETVRSVNNTQYRIELLINHISPLSRTISLQQSSYQTINRGQSNQAVPSQQRPVDDEGDALASQEEEEEQQQPSAVSTVSPNADRSVYRLTFIVAINP